MLDECLPFDENLVLLLTAENKVLKSRFRRAFNIATE